MSWLTLDEWCEENYPGKKPSHQTLMRWARNGNLYPPAEKHGREYRVKPETIYIQTNSMRASKQLIKTHAEKFKASSFMEKVINDTARKI
ncbi:Excisionase [Paramixta manurensis]|uniref:Excisionase n=1 Tax=Paramixta manurensis TaxID=2740817 RepID=A0A6M8U9P2_9GAMM|nr:Excisionase [Erwiniaceae bacterium PD-1]